MIDLSFEMGNMMMMKISVEMFHIEMVKMKGFILRHIIPKLKQPNLGL